MLIQNYVYAKSGNSVAQPYCDYWIPFYKC